MTDLRAAVLALAGGAVLLAPPLGDAGVPSAQASPQAQAPRVAMILLDVNHTMAATGIAQERGTALDYAGALPADVRVGLITFSDGWQMALRPTTGRGLLAGAVAATGPAGNTSTGVHRAISGAQSAVAALGATAGSRLLVLSDGEFLTASAPAPAIPTDVVAWYYPNEHNNPAALRALATASGGRVTGPLGAVPFAAAFPALKPAPTPARTSPTPARASPTSAQAHQPVNPAKPAQTKPAQRGGGGSNARLSWQEVALLGGVFIAFLLGILLLLGGLRHRDRGARLVDRVDRYSAARGARGEEKVIGAAERWVAGLLRSHQTEQRLAERLDLAGVKRKPAQWVLLGAFASVALAVLLTVLTHSALIGILAGALAGWLGMRLVLNVRISRRRAAFADQLPDVLQIVASSLKSGFSLPQALDSVVREDTQPAAGEFSRALAETRIGVDLGVALDKVASRMNAMDLRWTVMAIRIQREVGGNLSEVLRTTVATMRERGELRRQVRALSAEGRLSGYILVALPIFVAGWLFVTKRSYLVPLYTTPAGVIMIVLAVVLVVVGAFWMRKVVDVEV
jgi:Flp pilus assembly protein TadB